MALEDYDIEQDLVEIDELISIAVQENVRSFLEIGSKYGGSLWRIARALPIGSKVVSVDVPMQHKNTHVKLAHCIKELCSLGYDARWINGNSTHPDVIKQAQSYGPYDLCFIDGNHSENFVRLDWKNYSSMARIIAFHDIAHNWQWEEKHGRRKPIDVWKVWPEIKSNYLNTREICSSKDDEGRSRWGIGIVWN
jgi:cephalosporin hydroxylase